MRTQKGTICNFGIFNQSTLGLGYVTKAGLTSAALQTLKKQYFEVIKYTDYDPFN